MNRPTKTPNSREESIDDKLNIIKKSTRDHLATFGDDHMCRTLAQAWPAVDAAITQIMKDMSRPASGEDEVMLNNLLQATSQIQSRLLKFVDRGNELLDK